MTPAAHVQILPEGVRRHLAELSATVLGELTGADVPASLVRVRAFAPARRARAGAGPLGATLDRDPAFRQHVAAAWRALHPELAAAIDGGSVPGAVDPALALVGVYLLRPEQWLQLSQTLVAALDRAAVVAAGEQSDVALRAELKAAVEEGDRLREHLDAAQARAAALDEQLTAARREARKLRSDADRARAQARAATEQAATDRQGWQQRVDELTEELRATSDRLSQATERVEQARRAERDGRSLADARVRLLLDTVVQAVTGLRRELALPPTELRPADLVTAVAASVVEGLQDAVGGAASARGQDGDDPARLARLLALPQPHLIVDGYNVTKSGYGGLALVDQRARLIDGLAGLAARTGAEVTCCFDGAEVDSAPAVRVRGVRVLFSDPGVTADDLVRRLVRAEPQGRVVVVVSTDGEVVRGVRAAGAHPVPAQALLRLLSRG